MEITTLIIGIIIGVVLGALLLYFILKSGNVPRKDFDELNQNYIKVNSDLQNSNLRISELNDSVQKEKDINFQQTEILNQLKTEIAKITAENTSQNQKISEQQEINFNQTSEIKNLQEEKQSLIALKAQLSAQNKSLQERFDEQKEEIIKLQEAAKNEFKILANEILEEKPKNSPRPIKKTSICF
jgi:hypothetical protein